MNNNTSQSQNLTLNILEIVTSKESVSISVAEYVDNDKLTIYRKQYTDYSFYRDANQVFAWKLVEHSNQNLPEEFIETTITKNENTLVFNKILEEAIVKVFKINKYKAFKPKYSSIWEIESRRESIKLDGLLIVPRLNFCIYPLYSNKNNCDKRIAALSVSVSQKYQFTIAEEEIKQRNIDTRNWKRNKKGEISGSLGNVLNFVQATGQQRKYDFEKSKISSNSYDFNKIVEFQKLFSDFIKPKLFLPDNLEVKEFFLHQLPNSNFNTEIIFKPKYYYYQDRTASGYYNEAVGKQSPYSYDNFKHEKINVLVVTPVSFELTVSEFIPKIKSTLASTFHLTNLNFKTVIVNSPLQTFLDALEKVDLRETNYHLAVVIVSQNDKVIPIQQSPYYTSKAKLLGQRIPTQKVTVEVVKRANNTGKLLLEAIALNIYSKIGGVAWAIEKTQKDKIEVVIGISSTVDFDKNRIIGFASIFDYNGNYLIGDCSYLSTFQNYAQNLESYLIENIEHIIKINNLKENDEFRLIFHLTKEASKKHEIKAIQNAIGKFPKFNIRFGIVHLSYGHNLRLFASSGRDEVDRGTFIQISTLQAILHFGKGTKIPVLARLDRRSDIKDIYDISKQVLFFSHLSYSSFKPANTPVTIKYPSKMAKLTSELSQVQGWDRTQLNQIKDLLWFI
jgi:hypothetical protein